MSIKNTKQAKRLIEAMAPEGEFLAFINEREAQMLRDAGGSGLITLAGIPSFTEDEEDTGDVSNPGGSMGGGSGGGGGGGGDDQEDDNARMMQAMGLTRGPTIDTSGEDQEDDNARMMQALGIVPGVTFGGTSNFVSGPQRLPDAKNLGINAALYFLGRNNPKVAAAIQAIRGGRAVINQFKNPDLGLDLTRREETELGVLQTKKENEQFLGPLSPKEQGRLEELEQKQAEEKK
jgi:hypothetical protein